MSAQSEWASLKAADQGGICPLCRAELIEVYGDQDLPEYVIATEHHKARGDTFRLLGICWTHARLLVLRAWYHLPPFPGENDDDGD